MLRSSSPSLYSSMLIPFEFFRYLYEISDYDVCLRIIETASSATQDKNSLQYAHLCNTAASCYYELNRIGDCRQYWEIALKIRENLLDEDDIDVRNDVQELESQNY